MNTDYFYKIYNSKLFSYSLILLFVLSISSLNISNNGNSNPSIDNNQLVNLKDIPPIQEGMILNAKDQDTPVFDGIIPEIPPKPEDIKIITEDKIISSLLNLTFTNNTNEELLKNIEKIYTQEITEELKSIEL